jgi:leucyl-tRNA synthetase
MNNEEVPVWVADYVLASYGTGAIMAVPAHDERDFEFASKFGLDIKWVIEPEEGIKDKSQAYIGEGKMINSGEYNELGSSEAKDKISDYIEQANIGKRQVQYHLHDWSISRQRYWGTPIPIIHCPNCGVVPVPDADLPVVLPDNVEFKPTGQSPLVSATEWKNVKCPKCGGEAQRETDTMDGFFDNSWYFFRYLDPKNMDEIFDTKLAQKWLPLQIYFGGAEHTLGHTLYSRFFTKFLFDLGLIDFEEYAKRRVNHGIVLGPDGDKMSKSKGNVVNPDDEVKRFGADTIRIHMAFFMPYNGTGPWVSERVSGSYRFLTRVWELQNNIEDKDLTSKDLNIMHKTIKKVTDDIEGISFNKSVAALMEWINYLSKSGVSKVEYSTLLILLTPFAPHITEELWEIMGENYSIHQQSWPKFDKKFLEEEEISMVIQVNGKVRDIILIQKDIESNEEVVVKMAKEAAKIQKFLEGKEVKKVIFVPGKVVNLVV